MTRPKKLPALVVKLREENTAARLEAAMDPAERDPGKIAVRGFNKFRRTSSYTLAEKYNLQHLFKDP